MRMQSVVMGTLLALAVGLTGCSSGNAPSPEQRSTASNKGPTATEGDVAARKSFPGRVVPGEYLVKFKASASKEHIARTLSKAAPISVQGFKTVPGLRRLQVAPGASPRTLADAFGAQAEIEYIEPNFVVSTLAMPNDPQFGSQWNLHSENSEYSTPDADIDAPEAWDVTTGGNNVVIAVIDSGVDYNHEDLAANIFSNAGECPANGIDDDGNGYVDDCHGIDTAEDDSDPMDVRGHGTHVAGTIGAVGNNGIGVAGVAWNVRILPCRFLDERGEGTTADAITCLEYIAELKDRGVNVVATNNSWGGLDNSNALRDAIAAQRQRGILFVAAAGNDNEDNDLLPGYPCSYDVANIVCVGSTNTADMRSYFSNFGRSTVHLSAPGEPILSTTPNNSYEHYEGTSMASPHVAGAIALLAAQDSTRDWRALKNLVIAGSDVLAADASLYSMSGRRLNAAGALSCSNSVVLARLQPATPFDFWRGGEVSSYRRPVGLPIPLKALHINCASANGAITVSVAPSGELVTLRDDGTGIDEAAADGIYSATWTPQNTGSFTLTFDGVPGSPVTVEASQWLKPGFPLRTISVDFYYSGLHVPTGSSTVVGNIDADPRPEILLGGLMYGPLYAWHHDGSNVAGWPVNMGGPVLPTLGELDGDASSFEVVTPVSWLGMFAFDGDGSTLPGWPATPSANAPAATADLDGDGLDEIIAPPVRRADGSRLNPSADSLIWSAAAVADLDADGEMDFISSRDHAIWASNRHGVLPHFPATGAFRLLPTFDATLVVGDVDGDGELEIVAPSYEYPEYVGKVVILSRTGQLERILTTTSQFVSTPALADLDGDGVPEIVVTTREQVYAWKGNGTLLPGWPVSSPEGGGYSAPVVGDVSGDGQPDVVVVRPLVTPYRAAQMWIYDRAGNLLPDFPMPLDSTVGVMPPAIADIDMDGRNDLVVGTNPDWGSRDGVFAYDFGGPGPFGGIEWGQHLGGADHRGYYELGKNLPNHAYLTTLAHGEGTITGAGGAIQCGADCIELVARGSSVTLTATPTSQGRFNRWLGACWGQGNPCTVSIQRYTSVAAQFDSPLTVSLLGGGVGNVTSAPSGISCPTDCTEMYDARSSVTLTATPGPNSAFDGWGGACSGVAPTCTVSVDAARTVTATFVTERLLTVQMTGTGSGLITSAPAGIECGSNCAAYFPANSHVTLTVVPDANSTFTGWTVPCPYYLSTTCTVTLDAAKTMTARFASKVKVTVSRVGDGNGTVRTSWGDAIVCGTRCEAAFDRESSVNLEAQPEYDSYFVEWSGACSGTGVFCGLYTNMDHSLTARFALKPVLRVAVTGNGTVQSSEGWIACSPGQGLCRAMYWPQATTTLTATPGAGETFTGWSGACTGQASSCTLTLSSATDVGALFTNLGT